MINRRDFLKTSALAAATSTTLAGLAGCASTPSAKRRAHVVVVGGGYGGATAAKYLRMWSEGTVDVTLIERNPSFVSCPVSNLVIGGLMQMEDITVSYDNLKSKWGVRLITDEVIAVDTAKRSVSTANNGTLSYDRLVLSPGIDFMTDAIAGLTGNEERIPHAWKAGAQTVLLRKQLEDMPDGGVYALAIPKAPYRCPPGPYERACLVANYFKKAKPKSKVLILDGNPDVTSKGPLFKKAWAELYGGMVEYRPQHKAIGVDAKTRTVKFEVQDDVKADVLNVLPVMRAGALAVNTGLANANARWCHVNFLNFESTAAKDIHIIGDAIQIAQGMPKSGHMANSHAKVTAAAIVAELQGLEVNPHPMLTNVCMSFVDDAHVIHVASVHEYQAPKKSFFTIGGSGGVSDVRSDLEGRYADAWAKNIWADMLT